MEHGLRVGGEDRVRPERPDLADQQLAQREVVGERAVGLVQEAHARVADHGRRGALLGLAQCRQLERIGVRVLAALVAARAAHQPADRPRIDPAGGRAGRTELGVVGVSGDDHEPGRAASAWSRARLGRGPVMWRAGGGLRHAAAMQESSLRAA